MLLELPTTEIRIRLCGLKRLNILNFLNGFLDTLKVVKAQV